MISGAMLNYEIGEDQWEDIGNMTQQGYFLLDASLRCV